MAADANLFAQYLRPPKSINDYMAEMDEADIRREQLAGAKRQNALQALIAQDTMDQRRIAGEDRTRLRDLAGQSGGDTNKLIQLLRGSGSAGLMGQADTLEKGLLERQKTEAGIGETKAKTAKEQGGVLDDAMKRYRGALDFIDTPEGAARWLQAQYSDPVLGEHVSRLAPIEQAVARIPRDPQGFQQWRQQSALGMEKFLEQQRLQATQAETARHNRTTERNASGQLSVAQANVGLRRAELEHSKSQPRGQFLETPTGYVLGDPRAGTVTPVVGPDGKQLQGKAADRALTDSQAKANLFGSRMQEADRILRGLDGKYSPMAVNAKMGAEKIPVIGGAAGYAGNLMLTEAGQQAEQAQRDFVNAILRRESGAVISDAEFANAQKQYFPQQGDSAATIDQKRRNRQIAIEGLMAEVPSGKRGVPSLSATQPAAPADFSGFKIIGVK